MAGFVDAKQMAAGVVGELALQLVHAQLADQSVGAVVAKPVGGVVFVDQGHQALGLVVFVMSTLTFGVEALGGQAAGIAVQASDVTSPVGVLHHLAQRVVLEAFYTAVGMFDALHFALGGALKLGGLAQGIDGDQMLAVVVAIGGEWFSILLSILEVKMIHGGARKTANK